MGFAKTEQEWAERAARYPKAELKRADLTYEDLADRLRKPYLEVRRTVAKAACFGGAAFFGHGLPLLRACQPAPPVSLRGACGYVWLKVTTREPFKLNLGHRQHG
jgi:hypothetical protein